MLGQLGETRLDVAIETDIAGDNAHAKPLDADTKGAIRDIHRRVGSAILFESVRWPDRQSGASTGVTVCPVRTQCGNDDGGQRGVGPGTLRFLHA